MLLPPPPPPHPFGSILCCLLTGGVSSLQVSQEMQNSVETVRMLVEEGKEQLAEILAQMGLIKDIQMSA